jgi:two-component system, NarL family, sensor histidine kinase DegS
LQRDAPVGITQTSVRQARTAIASRREYFRIAYVSDDSATNECAMLNYLSQRREQEQKEQQEFVAHEIHDGACQYTTAARMMFDTFRREQGDILSGDWSSFDMGLEFLDHANEELRRLVCGLRPIQLAAGDLPKAIECLIQQIRTAGGPEIEFCHDVEADRIPMRLELSAFRIVQESLANACRHSKSKRILVGLTQDDDSLSIQVQDWGIGFDPDRTPNGHYGVEGIRRRVLTLSGSLTIQSDPSEGTLIAVELPLRE